MTCPICDERHQKSFLETNIRLGVEEIREARLRLGQRYLATPERESTQRRIELMLQRDVILRKIYREAYGDALSDLPTTSSSS